MRLSLKALAGIWLFIFLILGGLFYSAHSRLKPDTLIGLLTEQVQKNYPGATLKVGAADYRLSLDFNLNLKNVELSRSGKMLGTIGELELKVPWWLILVNRGNVQINLSDLQVFIDNDEPDLIKPLPTTSDDKKNIRFEIPNYLAEARYTLRAKNISIRDTRSSRRYLSLSKFLIREFQYGKNSAFELNVPVEVNHKEANYNSELWLFGDLTPSPEKWKLHYRGQFKTTESSERYEIENLIIDGRAEFKPSALDFTTDLELFIEKDPIGQGRLSASNNDINLGLNFSALPLDFLEIFKAEIQNPYLTSLTESASGEIRLTKKRGADITLLQGKLSFNGKFPVSETDSFPGQWHLSFEDSKWETSFMSPKGEVSYFRRSVIDFKKSEISQYIEEIGFTDIDCNKVLPSIRSVQSLSTLDRPYFNSFVFLKNCQYEAFPLNATFKYGVAPDQKFYQASLNYDNRTFDLNYQDLLPRKSLSVTAKKFQTNSSFSFLAPYFIAEKALLDVQLEGRWSNEWYTGDWTIQSQFDQLTKGQGQLPKMMETLSQVFGLSLQPKTKFQAQIKKQNLEVISLMLESTDSVKITGSLSDLATKSALVLNRPKLKKSKPIRKDSLQINWKDSQL